MRLDMLLDNLVNQLHLLDGLRIEKIAGQIARLRRYEQLLVLRHLLVLAMRFYVRLVVLALEDARVLHPRQHKIVL